MQSYEIPTVYAPSWKWWLPPHYSSYGKDVDTLFLWTFWITMFTFVVVEIALVWFCLKYKRNPNRKTAYTHGSHKLEIIWTVIPAVILIGLGLTATDTWGKIKNPSHPDYPKEFGATVKITGQQFAWNVTYPGGDGKFDSDDDFTLLNTLNVPAGEAIRVMLTSKDVIHSFFCPVLRIKQDAVPGFVGNLWFDTTRGTHPGPDGRHLTNDVVYVKDAQGKETDAIEAKEECYEVACAELCGLGHYTMRMQLKAIPRADWEAWVTKESAKARTARANTENEKR